MKRKEVQVLNLVINGIPSIHGPNDNEMLVHMKF